MFHAAVRYVRRWRDLSRPAQLYLAHVALLTLGLSIVELFFNLAILAMGYSRGDLGRLNLVAVWVSVALSLPLWWLVTRIGLRTSLVLHGALQALVVLVYAFAPSLPVLLLGAGIAGASSVLLQVSAPPLMMRYSDASTRDYLFSASSGIAIGIAGLGSLVAGGMPALFGWLLGAGAESAAAYRATFVVAALGIVLALLPLLRLGEPPSKARHGEAATDAPAKEPTSGMGLVRLLLRRPLTLIGLLISPFLISIGAALLLPYLNLFFKQEFGVSDPLLGVIFAMLNVATGLAVLLGPALSARLGKIRTVALAQAVSIPFLLLMGFVPVLGLVVVAALARGALFNMARPLYDAFAMERTEEALRPTVIGIMGGAATAGYLFAPEVSVRVQEVYGFGPLFLATALCYGLATLAVVLLYVLPTRRGEKQCYNTAEGEFM